MHTAKLFILHTILTSCITFTAMGSVSVSAGHQSSLPRTATPQTQQGAVSSFIKSKLRTYAPEGLASLLGILDSNFKSKDITNIVISYCTNEQHTQSFIVSQAFVKSIIEIYNNGTLLLKNFDGTYSYFDPCSGVRWPTSKKEANKRCAIEVASSVSLPYSIKEAVPNTSDTFQIYDNKRKEVLYQVESPVAQEKSIYYNHIGIWGLVTTSRYLHRWLIATPQGAHQRQLIAARMPRGEILYMEVPLAKRGNRLIVSKEAAYLATEYGEMLYIAPGPFDKRGLYRMSSNGLYSIATQELCTDGYLLHIIGSGNRWRAQSILDKITYDHSFLVSEPHVFFGHNKRFVQSIPPTPAKKRVQKRLQRLKVKK